MDHSCRDAVARLIAWRVARGLRPCSAETGAYCTAREDLLESACQQLVRQTGAELEQEAPPEWLWNGRRVRVIDGSTITMPDTDANQAEYPQLKSQAEGCGFPIARIVVVFSLAVGTVLEAALGQYEGKQTGENSMFRTLHDVLSAGDVALADRYFSGWFDMALVAQRGVDVVVRKHQLRATDFRRHPEGTRRLGKDDLRAQPLGFQRAPSFRVAMAGRFAAGGRWAIYADPDELHRLRRLRHSPRGWPQPYPTELITPKQKTNDKENGRQ